MGVLGCVEAAFAAVRSAGGDRSAPAARDGLGGPGVPGSGYGRSRHISNPDAFVTGGAVQLGTVLDWRTQQYKYHQP